MLDYKASLDKFSVFELGSLDFHLRHSALRPSDKSYLEGDALSSARTEVGSRPKSRTVHSRETSCFLGRAPYV